MSESKTARYVIYDDIVYKPNVAYRHGTTIVLGEKRGVYVYRTQLPSYYAKLHEFTRGSKPHKAFLKAHKGRIVTWTDLHGLTIRNYWEIGAK